ncbi:hypothetical protein ACFQ05_11740 [Amycolatopsis umgeniensis]|uniref:Scaffolding protein n=1 Tax=Amycolatopsis umgeniensis TaxID=336628 RepID=A0A841B4X4_9PSEU|nr:hypothetical protein [Amycolatopsis umgeniensis]MBB5853971.1 hypothetical protein [Amycolatopsis umgeniensis]
MSAPITPAGAAGETFGTPGEPNTAGQPPSTEQAPAAGQPSAPAPAEQGPAADELAALDPATLAKMVRDLRTENAADRTNAKTKAADEARQQLAQDISKALGLVADDDKADPAKLAEQVTAEQQRTRAASVELAVFKSAGQLGADPAALVDSRAFVSAVEQLDPTAADFADKVGAAITKAVTDNPKLRAAGQAPPRSSGQHAGGPGEKPAAKSLTDAISRHYGN